MNKKTFIFCVFISFFFESCRKVTLEKKPLSKILKNIACQKDYCLVLFGDSNCFLSKAFRFQFLRKIRVPQHVKKYYLRIKTTQLKNYATPILVLYKKGKPIDIHMGIFYARDKIGLKFNQQIINGILGRNRITNEKKRYIWRKTKQRYIQKFKVLSHKSIHSSKIPNSELQNKKMEFMIISGVDFRNSNFSQASLKNTIFTHSNLKNSNFSQASLKNTIWINTICPNGKNSNETGQTCINQIKTNM